MNDKFFLDTNILIYSFNSRELTKQQQAQHLIALALQNQRGIISFQVVQEFLNAARRKFTHPLSATDCQTYLAQVLMPLCQVFPQLHLYQTKSIDYRRTLSIFVLRLSHLVCGFTGALSNFVY